MVATVTPVLVLVLLVLLQATISGLWNAAYAVGWAAGPFLGGLLYDTFRVHTLCVGDKQTATCDTDPNGSGACSCTWQPDNGFDGFATVIAVTCALFAAVLFAAAAANVRNSAKHVDLASISAPSLEPLVATHQDLATISDWRSPVERRADHERRSGGDRRSGSSEGAAAAPMPSPTRGDGQRIDVQAPKPGGAE